MSETHLQTERLVPEQMIEGKYRIVRLIAEGGMGSVYHAVQEPLGRDVALKVLKPQDDTPEKREQRYGRFFREARHTSRLNHPNTVVIYDYGELSGREGFFFVMEYLEGRSLRELLVQKGSLPVDRALHIAIQIASSLSDAHEAQVIHRDLKPPNVMLVRRGDDSDFVKVVDFGLVKELAPDSEDDELTAENALIGSPMYMSPERFLYHGADSPAMDIYALGVMLYEMLVGRPPFIRASDSTVHHIMMQHIQDEPPLMSKFRPDLRLPDGLEALIMKCLAKEPEDRFPSMESLLRMLRACAASTGSGLPAPDAGRLSSMAAAQGTSQVERPSEQLFGPSSTEDATRQEAPLQQTQQPREHARTQTANTVGAPQVHPEKTTSPKGLWLALGAAVLGIGAIALIGILQMTPGQTLLEVSSQPAGAVVYHDGQNVGLTPLELHVEEPTTLRFEKAGFYGTEYRLENADGGTHHVDVELEIAPSGIEASETSYDIPRDSAIPVEEAADETKDQDEASETQKVAEEEAEEAPEARADDSKAKPRPRPTPRPKPKPKIDIKLDR